MPAWFAVTVQAPDVSSVRMVPDTEHTLGVDEVYVTAKPDDAVPFRLIKLPTLPELASEYAIAWACVPEPATETINATSSTKKEEVLLALVVAVNVRRTACPLKAETSYCELWDHPLVWSRLENDAKVANFAPVVALYNSTFKVS